MREERNPFNWHWTYHHSANKFWSGLLEDYYLPRASTYFYYLSRSLKENVEFELEEWERGWISYSNKWQAGTGLYPVKARGEAREIARALYDKYFNWTKSHRWSFSWAPKLWNEWTLPVSVKCYQCILLLIKRTMGKNLEHCVLGTARAASLSAFIAKMSMILGCRSAPTACTYETSDRRSPGLSSN